MVVDFVTCAHVEPTDEYTNSYVKSFLVAEKHLVTMAANF